MTKGIVIAATSSGSGKTTVALGLMAALVRRGLTVAPFKVGPDFIDPGHHGRITGRPSRNLDGWMLSRAYNAACFSRHTGDADIAVVEGVMGLFDGYDGKSEAGSTAQMAKWLGLPVLLVVDAGAMARSAAALVRGFERFDPDLGFAGVLFNKVGSDRHLDYLTEALAGHVAMPCLGGVTRDSAIAIPERHLGLVTDTDHPLTGDAADQLATLMESSLNLDAVLDALPVIDVPSGGAPLDTDGKPAVRIGVARDNAFCFYYPDNLDLLRQYGAEPVAFSPISDPALPENVHGLYLGGGYPELFAEALSGNRSLCREIRNKSDAGMPIYGECGGFMYLCREIVDGGGKAHAMTGCFPFSTRMRSRRKALGYRDVTLSDDTPLGGRGRRLRGHEFHYSELESVPPSFRRVYEVAARAGQPVATEGFLRGKTLGSYMHLHFGSCPEAARSYVEACKAYQNNN
jgi:cobyrinic acid a,c-diamide synthase